VVILGDCQILYKSELVDFCRKHRSDRIEFQLRIVKQSDCMLKIFFKMPGKGRIDLIGLPVVKHVQRSLTKVPKLHY